MSIKTIEYVVDIAGVTPATEQFGGMQGDHRVTKVEFEITDRLDDAITDYTAEINGKAMYRFDVYDGEGGIWQSEPKELENNVQLELEERHTRYGGKITVYLVITALSKDNETEMELCNFPSVLQLKNRPDGTYQDGGNHESVTGLVEIAKANAEGAASYSASAQAAELSARQVAAEVEQKLKNGEYKGEKGDTGPQGPKGEKGEPGADGKDAVTDQTYSPTSTNAQSGKAVAEAVSNFVPKQESNGMTYEVYALSPVEAAMKLEVSDNTMFVSGAHRGAGIPYRQSNGNLLTDTPVSELDCANKKYVDDLVGDIETLLGGI